MKTPTLLPLPVEQIPETLPRAQAEPTPESSADVLVVGAGPTGMACAIEAQKAGFKALIVDKGCLVNSIYRYPSNMVFFTTPELLEIGDVPFTTALAKPTRLEALEYYRRVAEHYDLPIRQYEWVKTITGEDRNFRVTTTDRHDAIHDYRARKIVLATGYYDLPNQRDVGGKNSAAELAFVLWRHGARVTLVHRGPQIHGNVKYWVRPDIENRIKAGEIVAHFNSTVQEIGGDYVALRTPSGALHLKNDFVFALTGYHPDFDFLSSVGIELSPEQLRPVCDPENLESNVPGIYVAGVIVAGSKTSEIFIENGRFHGKLIAAHLSQKLGGVNPNFPLDAT